MAYRLAISSGHIASASKTIDGVAEYVLNKKINLALQKLLRDNLNPSNGYSLDVIDVDDLLGTEEYSNRIEKYTDSLDLKIEITKQYKANMWIEFHFNSFEENEGQSEANGCEVWYNSTNGAANRIIYFIKNMTPFKWRGSKFGRYRIQRESAIPVLLIESLFFDHSTEKLFLNYENAFKILALPIYFGIKKYLDGLAIKNKAL